MANPQDLLRNCQDILQEIIKNKTPEGSSYLSWDVVERVEVINQLVKEQLKPSDDKPHSFFCLCDECAAIRYAMTGERD